MKLTMYDFGFWKDTITLNRKLAEERAEQRKAEGWVVFLTRRWFTYAVWLHEAEVSR